MTVVGIRPIIQEEGEVQAREARACALVEVKEEVAEAVVEQDWEHAAKQGEANPARRR
jgi:hypothetical protein